MSNNGKLSERPLSNEQIVTLSVLLSRRLMASALGKQFNGDRDLYEILGYPLEITFDQYWAKYKRQDISGKVVDLPAIDTWRKPPIIHDGDSSSDQEKPRSKFIQALQILIDSRKVWHYLQRVDRLAGIGRFGVLLIGTRGDAQLKDELLKGSLKGPQDVIYLSTFSEGSVTINTWQQDPRSERFGLPEMYTIKMGENLGSEQVHWSRTLHIAEDLLEDEVYGRPRLERIYNLLEDLLKIVGGGAEATWKVMDKGLHANVRDDFSLEGQAASDLSDEIDEYLHGLRRFIRTQGVDLKDLGSTVVDPSGLFKIIIDLTAAASSIPQRILLGSERGELASSQDQVNWAGIIAARQTQFAEPQILRPFIDLLIQAGALTGPKAGKYTVEWPSLFELSEKDRADLADKYASMVQKMAPGGAADLLVDWRAFRERVLQWPEEMDAEVEEVLDEEDQLDQGADGQNTADDDGAGGDAGDDANDNGENNADGDTGDVPEL